MSVLALRKKTTCIAFELGTCSLRGIQLVRAGRGWRVHHWVNIEVEPTSLQPDPIDYASHLRLALGPGSFSGIRAALLLSPPDVEYKLLEVPPAVLQKSPGEIRSALQFELDRQMPWPAAEMEMAAWSVDTNGVAGGNAMIVGARGNTVQHFVDVLTDQDLECVRADVVPSAMVRVCAQPGADADASAVWSVLDIGFKSCRLYMMHKSRVIYARVLRGGGRDLTETLARELHVEFRIAEQYKRIYGIKQTERGVRSLASGLARIDEAALPGVLYAIVRPVLETLISEIEKSYRFVMGRLPTVAQGPLYLVGGGARLQGLRDVLSSRMAFPACLPEPRMVLSTAGDDAAHPACSAVQFPVLAPCVGMALVEEES